MVYEHQAFDWFNVHLRVSVVTCSVHWFISVANKADWLEKRSITCQTGVPTVEESISHGLIGCPIIEMTGWFQPQAVLGVVHILLNHQRGEGGFSNDYV